MRSAQLCNSNEAKIPGPDLFIDVNCNLILLDNASANLQLLARQEL